MRYVHVNFKQRTGHALKVVVRPGMDWGEIQMLNWKTDFFHRYLQPLTNADGSTNLDEVKRLLMSPRNVGGEWALSTQAHKTWGVQ